MSTPEQQAGLAIVEFLKTTYEADKPAVLNAIKNAEGGAEAFIVKAIDEAPKPGGLLGQLFNILRPNLEIYVKNLVAQYGAEVIYSFIDSELGLAVKDLGG